MAKAKTNGSTQEITLVVPALNRQQIVLLAVGDSSLLSHAFPPETMKKIRGGQEGEARGTRAPKDPVKELADCLHWMSKQPTGKTTVNRIQKGKFGAPAIWFKACAVNACRQISGLSMAEAKQLFFVLGDLLPIRGTPPITRYDPVSLPKGGRDIRIRAEFLTWQVTLTVEFNANCISAAQIAEVFETGGFGAGVGDWRPQKGGQHGRFHIAKQGEKVL